MESRGRTKKGRETEIDTVAREGVIGAGTEKPLRRAKRGTKWRKR